MKLIDINSPAFGKFLAYIGWLSILIILLAYMGIIHFTAIGLPTSTYVLLQFLGLIAIFFWFRAATKIWTQNKTNKAQNDS